MSTLCWGYAVAIPAWTTEMQLASADPGGALVAAAFPRYESHTQKKERKKEKEKKRREKKKNKESKKQNYWKLPWRKEKRGSQQ